MRCARSSSLIAAAMTIAAVVVPHAAFAQTPPPTSSGPMTVERMQNGWLAAGDVKFTEVDDRASELVGGNAGYLFDDALFVGGGGYWLANNARDREMAYGGLVLGWLPRSSGRFSWGVKGLIGGGEATLGQTVSVPTRVGNAIQLRPTSVRFRDNFLVFEPEATASVRLLSHLRVTGGVGYRLIGSTDRSRVDDRLRGVTGTIGFQIS